MYLSKESNEIKEVIIFGQENLNLYDPYYTVLLYTIVINAQHMDITYLHD